MREEQATAEVQSPAQLLVSHSNALECRVEVIEEATRVASEDVRKCMDYHRGIAVTVAELGSRVATVEGTRTKLSQQQDLEKLQNAVMILTDTVDGKADRSQVVCVEEKVLAANVHQSGQLVSADMLQAMSEDLQQLANEVGKLDGKTEDAAEAVINLSTDMKAVSRQVEGIQVGYHLSVPMQALKSMGIV
jgi:hypothetical protein